MNEKCKHCGKEFPREDIIIPYNEFAYCPFCGVALFDLRSQDTNHWAWEHAPMLYEIKFGHYKRIENEVPNA